MWRESSYGFTGDGFIGGFVDLPGVPQELLMLFFLGVFFNIIFILKEGRIIQLLKNKDKTQALIPQAVPQGFQPQGFQGFQLPVQQPLENSVDDDDVVAEAQRVHQLVQTRSRFLHFVTIKTM
jgi:hypothetical protein